MLKVFSRSLAWCLVTASALTITTNSFAQEAEDVVAEKAAASNEAKQEELRAVAQIRDLAEFVDNILSGHPKLAAAAASRDEASALERAAERPVYNPELEADYESAADETYEVGISQTIDWGGKRKAAYAASGAQRRVSDANYELARNQITADILRSLSEYWTALTLSQLTDVSKSVMHDFSKQAGLRYQTGDMTRVEYETAQLSYAEIRMKKAEQSAQLAAVANELLAFGAPINTNSWPTMPRTLPDHTVNPRAINQTLTTLPQVVAARERANAAASEVDIAKSMKKPDPTIGVRVGEEDDESLVGVSFSIPLFVRNNFDENVMAAVSAKSRAEAEANSIERITRARLMVAMERFSTMQAAWTEWEEVSSVSVEVQTKLLTKLWEARELSMSNFLLQYRQTLEAQQTAAELRQTLWNAWIDYLEETNQVESWLTGAALANGTAASERKQ